MSRNFNAKPATKKPYCKVCHDAGKPESEYTSHWVRSLPDRTGKTTVTCPILLSTECRYCYKLGHTTKFCPVIAQNNKERERSERQAARQEETQKKEKIEKIKPARGFAALTEDSSDSEVEEKIKVSTSSKPIVEEFPALGAASKPSMVVHLPSVKPEIKTGWAAMAAKPKMVPVEEDRFLAQLEERSMIKNLPQSAFKSKVEPMPSIKPVERDMTKEIYTKSWADWTDSDDSDSDEEEVMPQITRSGPPMPYYKSAASVAVDNWDEDW